MVGVKHLLMTGMKELIKPAQKGALVSGTLNKAMFARTKDAEVPPVDPDNAKGGEGPLADLVSLLGGDGVDADGSAVRGHPPGSWEMHASHDLAAGETVGGGGPAHSIRPGPGHSSHCPSHGPNHAWELGLGLDWLLDSLTADTKVRVRNSDRSGGRAGGERHKRRLSVLPPLGRPETLVVVP